MKARILIITLSSLFLMSCGSDSGSKNKATGGTDSRGKPIVSAQTADERARLLRPDDATFGRVYIDDRFSTPAQTQDQFQIQVQSLLLASLSPAQIGTVDGSESSTSSGIDFWGQGITLNQGAFDPSTLVNFPQGREDVFNVTSAELRVGIYQQVASGLQEVPLHFNDGTENSGSLVDSYVEGSFIQLIFSDEFGKFSLAGNVSRDAQDAYQYEGQVYFKNLKVGGVTTNEDPQLLGRFSVSACGFFTCGSGTAQ